ncbi:MAG: hypothetical protein NTW29_22530 [Bacteroidetes bacterium]|nr:hypothetical protein [Bacteroidota bacterium]
MKNSKGFTLSPSMVPCNSTMMVQSTESRFPADSYSIRNGEEKVVRKGKIDVPANEFYLSSGGLDCGEYWIELGERKERFVVY